MHPRWLLLLGMVVTIGSLLHLSAADAPPAEPNALRTATHKGRELLLRAGSNWIKRKSCYACHHQTMPVFAIHATAANFAPAPDWLRQQSAHTHAFFVDRHEALNAGGYLPGGPMTASTALWGLSIAQHPADATTTALVAYLLKMQEADGSWWTTCVRPPTQASRVGATVLALIGMKHFAATAQQPAVAAAAQKAEAWLTQAKLRDTEDHFWRLWGLPLKPETAAQRKDVSAALRAMQRSDGGWGQTNELASDAYATGQALLALRHAGVAADDADLRRAADYLLRTQHADGSWHIRTRAKPVQPDFDNGDPHGKDQFISIAATAWATAALVRMLPPEPAPDSKDQP